MTNMTIKRSALLLLIAAILAVATPATILAQTGTLTGAETQVPQPSEGGVNWSGAGYAALAVGANIFYIPAKLVYAGLGGLVGAGTWAVTAGNTQVANTVWRSALGGDYVVTPEMIQGKERLNFSGPTETAPETGTASSASSAPEPAGSSVSAPPAISSASPPSGTASGAAPQPIDRGSGPLSGPTEKSIE
jgi:hypothetical protein